MRYFSIILALIHISTFSQDIENKQGSSIEDTVYLNKKKRLEQAYNQDSKNQIALNHFELGEYYEDIMLFSEAIEQYYEALKLTSDQDTLQINLNNNIASIYLSNKNFAKAKVYLQKSISTSRKINYLKGLGIAESTLGTCFEKEGKYLKALEHQQNSASVFDKLGDKHQIAIVDENIGSIYEDLNQFERALHYFEKSNAYFEKVESEDQIGVINNLGDVYRKTQKYQEAIYYSTKALDLAKTYHNLDEQKSAYKDLSEAYVEIGDYKNALLHLQNYDEVQNDLQFSNNLKQINTLQTLYETKEKEVQIELLTKQNEVNRANQNLLLGGTFTILIFSILFYYNLRRKRKDRNKVQAYEQKLLKTQLDNKAITEKKLNDEIQLKTASLTRYSLTIAQKNKLIADLSSTLNKIASRPKMEANQKIKTLAKELDSNLNQSEEWDEFMSYFKEINPGFFNQLNSISHTKLTTTEYRLSMLLRLKMSSKEIASILRITPDSVRVARYRLRKKLPIESDTKLTQFLQDL